MRWPGRKPKPSEVVQSADDVIAESRAKVAEMSEHREARSADVESIKAEQEEIRKKIRTGFFLGDALIIQKEKG